MKQTSPVSTRITGANAADDDDEIAGAVSEGEVCAFARKSFGEITSPYLSYVHKRGVLDAEHGLRKIGMIFFKFRKWWWIQ
jgi:hypothetical protein